MPFPVSFVKAFRRVGGQANCHKKQPQTGPLTSGGGKSDFAPGTVEVSSEETYGLLRPLAEAYCSASNDV